MSTLEATAFVGGGANKKTRRNRQVRLDVTAALVHDSEVHCFCFHARTQEVMAQVIRQAAVIPMSDGQICMVTSSSGRRWVLPKGMIDTGHTAGEAALNEAWEEAGLVGLLAPEPAGSYLYDKYGRTHHVVVFLMHVKEMASDWPERDVRRREWVDVHEAMDRIEELGLREIVDAACRQSVEVDVR